MQQIILFSIRNKVIIATLVLALVAWGVFSLSRLPLDAIPDITNNQVNIVTIAPNLAPVEMEQFVTYPIELAMANIQGLIKTRSVSQFGLSIVTLDFKEHVDPYFARNQANERLSQVRDDIPKGFGSPQLLPLTTGLGEVFQYSIEPIDPNDTTYSLMDLRTAQDWIVKRMLLGTDGVAEVSSFGGNLKQVQVRVKPELLRAAHITLDEVFAAVERGNQNTGAAYIEKENQLYFIRGVGLATTYQDIENTFIKMNGGVPVAVKDVATVETGAAIRFGTMVHDGHETAGGIVLMLKGENSRQVILNVKKRLADIEKALPKGLHIVPFLDREVLITRTIATVTRNLMEGGLIVIFVLVLLLGQLRAGLIVASVIPLSMLFAIAMMVAFGVSGNLMSLGAIDFGLMVDGAVIIVENVIHRLTLSKIALNARSERENVVFHAANEIRQSALFGEIIIMIVYIPLLLLEGIEGKMFRPMALTVIFALVGAFLLSLTYVPMMSAWLLSQTKLNHDKARPPFAERLVNAIRRPFLGLLRGALRRPITVFAPMLVAAAVAVWLFSGLGGEFIPQLDEGDYAVEIRMLPGTSLHTMIEVGKKVGSKLLKDFPTEIQLTNGKMGASEVPTDPMGIEEMDLILKMNPIEKWKRCHDKADFERQLDSILTQIPGIYTSIQQPIAMRFNELMTGAKTDVIVRISGNDLDKLAAIGTQVVKNIHHIEGAQDVGLAKAEGIPQLFVTYDRAAMLRYGVTMEAISNTIQTAVAGRKAGVMYDQNRRYDLVVRLNNNETQQLTDLPMLLVSTGTGTQIPLEQLAKVEIKVGPMAVNRENNERCVYVNLNVRGRDVASVVADVQATVARTVKIPSGYRISYGGQFEQLQSAKARLSIVVPAALALILLLLYLTFGSFAEALLVFSAIPLAAIGGVMALWLRGLPFSISAGVGFIALFGVAVLNGMVLIGHFNQLESEGVRNLYRRVLQGVSDRFRPVLMTATVASLGFLPMALGTGSGAEVQRPLATVVIGGLLTATLLTLFVLPLFYALFFKNKRGTIGKNLLKNIGKNGSTPSMTTLTILILALGMTATVATAQPTIQRLSEDDAVALALGQNPAVQRDVLQIEQAKALLPTAYNIPNPEIFAEAPNKYLNIGFTQNFQQPKVYRQNALVLQQRSAVNTAVLTQTQRDLTYETRRLYQRALFAQQRQQQLQTQDAVFKEFNRISTLERQVGNITPLQQLNERALYSEYAQLLRNATLEQQNTLQNLQQHLQLNNAIALIDSFAALPFSAAPSTTVLPNQQIAQAQIDLRTAQLQQANFAKLPAFSVGLNQLFSAQYQAPIVHAGILLPIWKKQYNAQIQATELERQVAEKERTVIGFENQKNRLRTRNDVLLRRQNLDFFTQIQLPLADAISRTAQIARNAGTNTGFEYVQSLRQAFQITLDYLDALRLYNEAVIEYEYWTK